MNFRISALLACLLSISSPARAQDEDRKFAPVGPFVFLLDDKVSLKPDGSYLFQHSDGDLIFEAQIAPDVRIVDNFGRALERVFAKGKPRVFAYSAFGTFLVRLRMFDEVSDPVRTPSYMPKGTVQLAWLKNLSPANPDDDPVAFIKGPVEMWLVNAIPFGHHSNGQNGCLFVGQVRIEGECGPPPPATAGPDDVNVQDGSFSTNYIRVGLDYRRLHTDGDDANDTRAITRREWGIGGSVELNPSGYVGGALDDALRPLYGPTRFQVNADFIAGNFRIPVWPGRSVHCGRAWTNAAVTYISGAAESVDKVATAIESACLPARWGGAGLFVRYYRGQDYYNASFLQNINRLQFGVTFLQGKFLAFRTISD